MATMTEMTAMTEITAYFCFSQLLLYFGNECGSPFRTNQYSLRFGRTYTHACFLSIRQQSSALFPIL